MRAAVVAALGALVAAACWSGSTPAAHRSTRVVARAPASVASTTAAARRVTTRPSTSTARTAATASTKSTTSTATTLAPVARATTSTARTTVPALPTVRTVPTVAPPPTTSPAPATGQAITVSAPGWGTSNATLSAWERRGGRWVRAFGPWSAVIGRNGVAPAGAKREGDGRTPSGTYGFSFFFGTQPNPGVRFSYRGIPGPYIVWDDDPASPSYNLWRDTRTQSAGANPEPMDVSAYAYGAVIAYNTARTPGLGSAIFLHVATSWHTAGCVAVPTSELLSLLRWMDPALGPTITIGVGPQSP